MIGDRFAKGDIHAPCTKRKSRSVPMSSTNDDVCYGAGIDGIAHILDQWLEPDKVNAPPPARHGPVGQNPCGDLAGLQAAGFFFFFLHSYNNDDG